MADPARITGATRLAAVIGSPVRHSRSPVIHNAAFAATGLDWRFVALEVAAGDCERALDGMRALGLGGLSVTTPHKDDVARLVDERSDDADALGAVNCVVPLGGGRLRGENTDGAGFVAALRERGVEPAGLRCCVLGAGGDRFVAAAIAISTFGFLDLAVLAPTRVYYAAAADGYLPAALARLHPTYGTPTLAIVVQAIWAVTLVLTGTYGDLLDSVVFADWIFFGGTVAALFVWRRRGGAPPTYRSPGYPVLPAFFVLVAVAVVVSVVIEAPARAAIGTALIATGIPVFYYFGGRRMKGKS